jgi:hypothetical protein
MMHRAKRTERDHDPGSGHVRARWMRNEATFGVDGAAVVARRWAFSWTLPQRPRGGTQHQLMEDRHPVSRAVHSQVGREP